MLRCPIGYFRRHRKGLQFWNMKMIMSERLTAFESGYSAYRRT
ncbi:hypothetical protein NEICINOT_03160 [Neisseria cinerea ATCC 14685]|uniref:Uncharacterized protein n=1 Tax=Neisseria cinerea ATCC 14685 TaxID=546262 RepID=D0W0J4_NEICI|nr:hypothetical protein NEICINOT_03160 [Neisseria cinerea ATCC 14685]